MQPIRWFVLIALLVITFFCAVAYSDGQIRESVIAGTWYTRDPRTLELQLSAYLENASLQHAPGKVLALIVPHAGYRYSGQVAAHAYKLLENKKIDTVIVIAPSHHASFRGVSVYDRGGYRTPLGLMPLDDDFIALLKTYDATLRHVTAAHAREHAIEIQVPFLQLVCPKSRLVPIVMGEQGLDSCRRLAKALAACTKGKSVLIVASSDLSHYHSARAAKKLDSVVMDRVRRMDAGSLSADLQDGRCEACGGGPMVTAILAAKSLGADTSEVLCSATSGDVTGDQEQVVGYMAAGLWKAHEKSAAERVEEDTGPGFLLTNEEKLLLHRIAGDAITCALAGRTFSLPSGLPKTFEMPCGAFVTLKIDNRLRGCIGHIVALKPLAQTVRDMAVAAAMEDPRFSPLTAAERPNVTIEISVMSPLRRVTHISEITPGRHGLYVKKGRYAGLLLPQVATEYGWDRETFLAHTCQKAGLPKDAWKKDAWKTPGIEIYSFTAEVF